MARGTDLTPEVHGDALELGDYFKDRKSSSLWSSPEKYTRYIEGLDRKSAWEDAGWDKGNDDFYGTSNMEEAFKLAHNGWKEGMEQIERVRGKILALHPLQKKPAEYDIVGAVPSVPRAVAGNIKNMKKAVPASARKRPILTVVSNMAATCGVDNKSLSNRAAVIAALIDTIESRGFACEVLSVACSKGHGEFRSVVGIMVKESHQPVDLQKLAFAMGHASMFRRFTFADKGTNKNCQEGLGWGLGTTERTFEKDEETFKEKGVYSIASIMHSGEGMFKTEDKAATEGLNWLVGHLRDQNCPAFPPYTEYEWQKKQELIKFNKERGWFEEPKW